MSGQPWYDVPSRPMRYRIEVGSAIDPRPFADGKARGAAARELMAALRDFYEERLQNHA